MKDNPTAIYKTTTYKLRGISYMSLSLNYLIILLVLAILLLITVGYYINTKQYIKLIFSIILIVGAIGFVYHTGIKHGRYGLEILLGKAFQKKHIKNDFPIILHRIYRAYKEENKEQEDKESEDLFFSESTIIPEEFQGNKGDFDNI